MEKLTQEEKERLNSIVSKLTEYQIVADALRQHLTSLTAMLSELTMSLETIRTIKELKAGIEILVPVGSDSFIAAKLASTDRVITGLGADVAAERSTDEAIRVLEDRKVELERALAQAREELDRVGERMEAIRPEAERILSKVREESFDRSEYGSSKKT